MAYYNFKRFNQSNQESLGSVADSINYSIKKGVVAHKIRFVLQANQNGATIPTLSDFLTQLGSEIDISIGNKTVIKKSPTELYEYMKRKRYRRGLTVINDGSGADNQIMLFIFDIPLAPLDKYLIDGMNEEFGFDGQKEVSVKLTYPADGNKLDGRLIDMYAVSIPGKTPSKVVEIEDIDHTPNTVGNDQVLEISQNANKSLLEVIFKQTSYLAEGLTSFAMTIETLDFHINNESIEFFDMPIHHLQEPYMALDPDGSIQMLSDDQYISMRFYVMDDHKTAMKIRQTNRIVVKVGVAETFTYTQLRIVQLSEYRA